jgi:hypothetical protein
MEDDINEILKRDYERKYSIGYEKVNINYTWRVRVD